MGRVTAKFTVTDITRAVTGALEDIDGCARIETHCLYPSFEIVSVYVKQIADGYTVSDGGDTISLLWMHGLDVPAITTALTSAANRYSLTYHDGILSIKIESLDWLHNAVLAVSNAAAQGAYKAIDCSPKSSAGNQE